jgi:hypothetical protein
MYTPRQLLLAGVSLVVSPPGTACHDVEINMDGWVWVRERQSTIDEHLHQLCGGGVPLRYRFHLLLVLQQEHHWQYQTRFLSCPFGLPVLYGRRCNRNL